ncbi:GDSL family lipase [Nostoc sp. NIES-2111]|nr:GDSL family lipase [Nostoc sp. NIES-2111]
MPKKNLFSVILISFVVFLMVVSAKFIDNTHPISEMYVFGDSLSDAGMVFRATGGIYPPQPAYYQGRYSNGRVWVEYLSDRLHLSAKQTNNFAYGGATTGNVGNAYVPSLLAQVQSFTQTHQSINPDSLYVLWAGAQEYLQGVTNANIPVQNVTQAIASLNKVGAKKILVGNIPDLGQLPATRTGTNSANLSTLTQEHNQGLRRSLKLLSQQNSELDIVTFNANALYRDAIANPAIFGFTNVINPCLSGSNACGNPNQFLFWDGIHPTTAAHRIISDTAFSAIQEAGIVTTGVISH